MAVWLTGYNYRVLIPCTHTDAGAQTNYTKEIQIVKASGTNAAGHIHLNDHSLAWPYDIRFTKSDGETKLDYYREEYDTIDGTWHVELDSIADSGDTDFYIYYGKTSDTDDGTYYGGSKTFIFFDDFETGDLTKWDTAQADWTCQSVTKYSGTYAAKCDGTADANVLSKTIEIHDHVFHMRCRTETINDDANWFEYYTIDHGVGPTYSLVSLGMFYGYWVYESGTGSGQIPSSPYPFTAATWYEIDTAHDFTNGTRYWWINGNYITSTDLRDTSNNVLTSTQHVAIVYEVGYSECYLDEVWIRNYVYPEPEWTVSPGSEKAQNTICSIDVSSVIIATPSIELIQSYDSLSISVTAFDISASTINYIYNYVIAIPADQLIITLPSIALSKPEILQGYIKFGIYIFNSAFIQNCKINLQSSITKVSNHSSIIIKSIIFDTSKVWKRMGKIYQNSVGVQIIVDTGQTITDATLLRLVIKKPSGQIVNWTATAYDATSIQYTTVANDLNETGIYKLQSYIEWVNQELSGSTSDLLVYSEFS